MTRVQQKLNTILLHMLWQITEQSSYLVCFTTLRVAHVALQLLQSFRDELGALYSYTTQPVKRLWLNRQ